MKQLWTSMALAASALAAQAVPVTVDFEGLPLFDNPNPLSLSGAHFTTVGGFNVIGGSASNWLCAAANSGSTALCTAPLEITFDGVASGISFEFLFNNTVDLGADIGDVALYAGAVLLGIEDVRVLDGDFTTPDLVSLAGYGNVTRMVLTSVDLGGVGYDNFRFDLDPGSVVPEPAGWALVLSAAGLASLCTRRRRAPPAA